MRNFVLVSGFEEKQINKYQKNHSFKRSFILPYYDKGYVCFSSCKNFSFEELIEIFIEGDKDEQIGAISIIAEKYPNELYQFMSKNDIPKLKLMFIFDKVIQSYLPLILPQSQLMHYQFSEEYSNDPWVKILEIIRNTIK